MPDDNPPIGMILSREKDELLVEYATYGMDSNLFVSKYELYLPNKEELKRVVDRTKMNKNRGKTGVQSVWSLSEPAYIKGRRVYDKTIDSPQVHKKKASAHVRWGLFLMNLRGILTCKLPKIRGFLDRGARCRWHLLCADRAGRRDFDSSQ